MECLSKNIFFICISPASFVDAFTQNSVLIIQSVYFLPVLWVLKFVDNYYIPVILMGIIVFIYCSSYADKWASRIKDLTKEYQRAALRQLIDEKQKVYIKTESIEG